MKQINSVGDENSWTSQGTFKAQNSVLFMRCKLIRIQRPIDITSFSNWNLLVGNAACCFFCDCLKRQSNHFSVAHFSWTYKNIVVAHCQNFRDEILSLQKIPCHSRLSKTTVLKTSCHLLILDGVHPTVKLLTENCHVMKSRLLNIHTAF